MYGNKRIICWAPVTHRPRISAGHLLHFTRCGVSARRLGELGAGVIIRRPTHSKGQNQLKICLPTALSQKPVHTATGRVIGKTLPLTVRGCCWLWAKNLARAEDWDGSVVTACSLGSSCFCGREEERQRQKEGKTSLFVREVDSVRYSVCEVASSLWERREI